MQHIRPLEYLEPQTVEQACTALMADAAIPLAGGTDLTVILRRAPRDGVTLVNLKKIPGLCGIRALSDGSLRVGGMTTVADTADFSQSPALAVLRMGCNSLGTPSVRNLATIGGNVGRASPASDILPALLALDARAVLATPNGETERPVENLLAGPGRLDLRPGEFVTALVIPAPKGSGAYFKIGRVRGADCALAGVAVRIEMQEGKIAVARIGLGAVGPKASRSLSAEKILTGQAPSASLFEAAADAAAADARPITDFRGGADYKRHLVKVLTIRGLEHALSAI